MADEKKQTEASGGAAEAAAARTDTRPRAPARAATEGAPAAEGAGAEKPATEAGKERPARAKVAKHVSSGIVHINATFNNTIVTITDLKGAAIAWCSAGRMGLKGTRKSTAYAATIVAQEAARQASAYRLQEVEVRVQGPGSGRESAIRALQSAGLTINLIRDVTPIPHNGCRPRKRRRV